MTFSRDTRTGDRVNLAAVSEVVADRIWKAMIDASRELDRLGIKHVRTFLAEHASELAVLFDALVARARAEEPSV